MIAMYKIKTLNKIAACGLNNFGANYTVSEDEQNPDAIILRSFNMHETELPESLKAIARAGAGTNNIPIDKCSEKGIVVFNTPGANANAVKELAIAAMLLASRDIIGGIDWAKTLDGEGDAIGKLVEKGKSNFAGTELMGKTLGVIGLGAIGVMLANSAYTLGMDVIGYDPFLSIDAAWGISRHVTKSTDLKDMFAKCDYISIHVPLNDNTRNMINAELFAAAKPGIKILNLARGGLVDEDAIEAALENGTVSCYITDFPDARVIGMKNTIAIPHLGASTEESEDNCAIMAARELIDYLENGNIKNSVNFPECSMPRSGKIRIAIAHRNVPNMINAFTGVLSENGTNIENFINKSKKSLAFTIIDTDGSITDAQIEKFKALDDVLSVTLIKD